MSGGAIIPPRVSRVNSNPRLQAALSYLRRGWAVFPLRPGSKKPLRGWKRFAEKRLTEEEAHEIWTNVPGAGVGIPCGQASGGLVVVDVDNAEAAPPEIAAFPPTPTVETRPGRRQFYFSSPEPVRTRRFPWGEIRGDGAYVVAPPSRHPAGHCYRWLPGRSPDDVPLAPLPDWLKKLALDGARSRETTLRQAAAPGPHEGGVVVGASEPSTSPAPDLDGRALLEEIADGEIRHLILRGRPRGKRSEACWKVLCHLVEAGWDDLRIAALLLHPRHRLGERYRERGRRALDVLLADIARARRKAGKSTHVGFGTAGQHGGRTSCTETDKVSPSNDDEWVTDPPWLCGSTLAALYSKAEKRVIVIRLRCGLLTCPTCGPRWRKQRLEHLRALLSGHDHVYLIVVAESRWETMRDGLRRKIEAAQATVPADEAGIPQRRHGWAAWRGGGVVTIVSTVAHHLRDGSEDVAEMAVAQAADAIRFQMAGLKSKGDFSTSHTWSLRRVTKGYKLLGYVQGDLEAARRLTDQFGGGRFQTWSPPEDPLLPWREPFEGFVADLTRDVPDAVFPALATAWWRWLRCKLLENTLDAAA